MAVIPYCNSNSADLLLLLLLVLLVVYVPCSCRALPVLLLLLLLVVLLHQSPYAYSTRCACSLRRFDTEERISAAEIAFITFAMDCVAVSRCVYLS